MCARFTVLSDTPIASAIAGCVIPLSRSNTIWTRWRSSGFPFQRSAVFNRRAWPLVHLTICGPRIRWSQRITPSIRCKTPSYARRPVTADIFDSNSYGSGITSANAACLNLKQTSNLSFDGILSYHIFAGPPNYEDVRKGDTPAADGSERNASVIIQFLDDLLLLRWREAP